MWADANSHQSHWSGWSIHDLQGDSSSAMLTVNYGDRDSKKTTVILVKCRTAFVAEHVKQHRCSFETILFTFEGIAFSVIRTSHHAVCSNRMFCILFTARKKVLVWNQQRRHGLTVTRVPSPPVNQLQVYLHTLTFHRSGMWEGYNLLSLGTRLWGKRKRLSMYRHVRLWFA